MTPFSPAVCSLHTAGTGDPVPAHARASMAALLADEADFKARMARARADKLARLLSVFAEARDDFTADSVGLQPRPRYQRTTGASAPTTAGIRDCDIHSEDSQQNGTYSLRQTLPSILEESAEVAVGDAVGDPE